MATALELKSVSKAYKQKRRNVQALKEVSLSIDEGEVFGFVGPNGAGKSTTIKIILDIIRDYEGEVRIYGEDARKPESRKDIAYLPETPALYDQLTPLEVLKVGLRMHGIQHTNEDQWCMHWLDRLSIEQYAKRRIRKLSKGNVQRVAIAHAVVVSPKLLILDEPLSGLDPVGRKDVIDMLEEYKNEGGAMFFTSHVLHDVERIADRFGFITDGELLTTRSPQDVMSEHADSFYIRYHSGLGLISDGKPLREGEFEVKISQSDMPSWITRLNADNGRILNVKPSVSLESVFFSLLERKEKLK